MNIGEDTRNLIAFTSTLVAIVLLSWLGGSGADLAIMTGLVGVLGMLARPARAQSPNGKGDTLNVEQADTVNQKP